MSGLVLKNINKTFPGDQQAIRDFNLEVKDREFLILVGPTACGKSTLLRMIGGLEEITSGSLMIDGMDMTDADPKERNVAMLFKNSVLYPGMQWDAYLLILQIFVRNFPSPLNDMNVYKHLSGLKGDLYFT